MALLKDMASKSRKSISSSWCSCENCGAIISQKDTQIHSESNCPPSEESHCEHPYIKNETLYSKMEYVNEVPANLSAVDCDELVFISQSAMQLCKMQIGEPVIVTGNIYQQHNYQAMFIFYKHSEIKCVWPTSEKSLLSVLLTKAAVDLCWDTGGSPVTVSKMSSPPLPAAEVIFEFVKINVQYNIEVLLKTLKQLSTGKIIRCGSKMSVPFYGQTLTVKVVKIVPEKVRDVTENETALTEMVSSLSLTDKPNNCWYKVYNSTKVHISGQKAVDRREQHNKITLENLGGYEDVVSQLKDMVNTALSDSVHIPSLSYTGVLLYGPHGTGKTFIAKAMAGSSKAHLTIVQSGELFSKYYGETESRLKATFMKALDNSPSIILLDDVDTLCPKRKGTDQEKRVVATLITLLDLMKHSCKKIVVLATTSDPNSIDAALRRPGRLDREIEVAVPTPHDRLEIMKLLLQPYNLDTATVESVSQAAHGFVASDLCSLVTRASAHAIKAKRDSITFSDLQWALSQVKPSAMREIFVQVPNVHWSDIGGLEDLKHKLKQAVEWPLRHREAFSRLGIEPPHGILMFGPPGCSKTMIVKALATESKLNFLTIKASELFSKWVGESERAVRDLFKKARTVAPSVVFFDELDALGAERSGTGSTNSSSVQERVLAQLLTELDGVEPLGNVTVVAATNRPDKIDKALLRPGRFDRLVYVPLPDVSTRSQILQIQFQKMPVASDVSVEELANKMEGYSGAEVVAVCHEAAINALQENIMSSIITRDHFMTALNYVTPRTPQSLIELYKNYLQ